MSEFEKIKEEAIEMIQIVYRLRIEDAANRADDDGTDGLVTYGDLAARFVADGLPKRTEPRRGSSPSKAYEKALRFWAQRAALQITEPQWQELTWAAADAVPEFPGSVIRFFENRFEGLTLKDGAIISA